MTALKTFISGVTGEEKPIVLLAFDEIGTIVDAHKSKGKNSVNPAKILTELLLPLEPGRTTNLIITALSSYAQISSISPPLYALQRELVTMGMKDDLELNLPVPFTELPMNCFLPDLGRGKITLVEACALDFLTYSGRPL